MDLWPHAAPPLEHPVRGIFFGEKPNDWSILVNIYILHHHSCLSLTGLVSKFSLVWFGDSTPSAQFYLIWQMSPKQIYCESFVTPTLLLWVSPGNLSISLFLPYFPCLALCHWCLRCKHRTFTFSSNDAILFSGQLLGFLSFLSLSLNLYHVSQILLVAHSVSPFLFSLVSWKRVLDRQLWFNTH